MSSHGGPGAPEGKPPESASRLTPIEALRYE
jgi:hypothetical protein